MLMTTYAHKITCAQFAHKLDLLCMGYGTKKWLLYEWELVYFIMPNQTQGIDCEHKFQKNSLTFALAINLTCTKNVKLVIDYKSPCPRCFGRCLPTNYVWWFAIQIVWMTLGVFKSWIMSLNVHFKSQKWKILLIMNNYSTHSLKQVWFFNLVPKQLLLLSYHLMLQIWYNLWIRE